MSMRSSPFSFRQYLVTTIVLLGAIIGSPSSALAQTVASNASTVILTATLGETMSIVATPAAIIALLPGTIAATTTPVSIVTTWVAGPSTGAVTLYAWFASTTVALTDSATPTPDVIPSSEVYGEVTTGLPTTYTAFTQSNTYGTALGGLKLFTQALTSLTRASTRTDNLWLQVNLAAQPQLPSGVYVGTVNIQAQAL